jgi:hypothetical protein
MHMTGKDWFILGIRLVGLGVMYMGVEEILTYVVRDMLMGNVEYAYFPQPTPGGSRLLHGFANIGIALLALTQAERFADWCYGKKRDIGPLPPFDDARPSEPDPIDIAKQEYRNDA